jgi:hypothetical protein
MRKVRKIAAALLLAPLIAALCVCVMIAAAIWPTGLDGILRSDWE